METKDKSRNAVLGTTPLMQQYHDLKARYPHEFLFFHLGDFYELFGEDAQRAAPILEVTLTHRQQVPMCGVPVHAIDSYIAKLLKAGHRVAIADQLENPEETKGLVKRDVIRVITPGTLQEDALLQAKRSNYLAALTVGTERIGLAVIECSTGEFLATETTGAEASSRIWDEINRLNPSEIIVSALPESAGWKERLQKHGIAVAELPAADFSPAVAEERLKQVFKTASLRGFGLEGKTLALSAAGAAARYLELTRCGRPYTLRPLHTYSLDEYLLMDANTLDHLDLVKNSPSGVPSRTLLGVIDQTLTPMGGRLMRRWLLAPLKNVKAITERQAKVEFFLEGKENRRHLRAILQGWPDMERILTRLGSRTISPRDLAGLGQGLRRVQKLKSQLAALHAQATALGATVLPSSLERMLLHFPEEPVLADLLEKAVIDGPPATLKEGGVIRPGYNAELDEVRTWIRDGKSRLLELEKREREQTGISSLKVGFNNIFGYYIEVTHTHAARVPLHYVRKQTLANAERFITPELKEYETRILGAEERAIRLEMTLVQGVADAVLAQTGPLQALSQALAELDVCVTLSEVAERHHYTKPVIEDSDILRIRDGRHPVLDEVLPAGTLVPNDLDVNGTDRQILILTGPNMSGKSTYLRQTALIVILAQMGSYVPAAEARVGVVDHIFTRIGASDRLTEGESTFMVEMVETAHILNHATPRSLVILDEVGRGTSTYDGISIAWACLEFLHRGPKVLFATHYFELTELAEKLPGVQNAHVTAREWKDEVVFLHKVEPGPADRAYGIHVAKLAGVPRSVLERAQVLLHGLERKASAPRPPSILEQPALFNEENSDRMAWEKELKDLDLNALKPIDALLKLQEWKNRLDSSKEK